MVIHSEYSNYRNKTMNLIRKCKENFYQNSFSRNISNIRATWKLINKICNRTQTTSIDKIILDGNIISEPIQLAESFNNFFVNIDDELAGNLPHSTESPYKYVKTNPLPHIELDPVTPQECSAIINSLKNTKECIDHISVEIFKKFHGYILPVLCDLINLSFTYGIFPDCFKHATVIPIFKKGDPQNISNYRPIALLPFIGKIFERCIFARLLNYANLCNILSPNQFGFTKGKSTQDAVIMLVERVYHCLNESDGSFCANVFVDFMKCFDTIDHRILFGKLDIYGIKGMPLILIISYLTRRTQSVRVVNTCSSPRPITKGVPQGSILGPLLFLFFINDLTNISNNFIAILFADDTTISFKCNSTDHFNYLSNIEMHKFFLWASANKLSINFGKNKTYYIIHSFRNFDNEELNLRINENVIENLNEGLFLGTFIDKKLNYQAHIDYIARKISKSIGILYKLNQLKASKFVLKQTYHCLVHSYLNYNICCYAGTYDTHLNRLLLLQKRAIRIINKSTFLANTDPLFYSNKILKIHDMYKLNVGLYMFDRWESGSYDRTHDYNTRNRDSLVPNTARLTVTQNSLSVVGPNLWNTIPQLIQHSPSKLSFRNRYKEFLLSQYV